MKILQILLLSTIFCVSCRAPYMTRHQLTKDYRVDFSEKVSRIVYVPRDTDDMRDIINIGVPEKRFAAYRDNFVGGFALGLIPAILVMTAPDAKAYEFFLTILRVGPITGLLNVLVRSNDHRPTIEEITSYLVDMDYEKMLINEMKAVTERKGASFLLLSGDEIGNGVHDAANDAGAVMRVTLVEFGLINHDLGRTKRNLRPYMITKCEIDVPANATQNVYVISHTNIGYMDDLKYWRNAELLSKGFAALIESYIENLLQPIMIE